MSIHPTMRAMIQSQQDIIEQLRIDIERRLQQMDEQVQRTVKMQVQFERLQAAMQSTAPELHPTAAPFDHDNGHQLRSPVVKDGMSDEAPRPLD